MWIMELRDKQHSVVNRAPAKENEYINTALKQSDLSLLQVEENEYDVLRRETGSIADQASSEKTPPKPTKRQFCVLVGLVVPLYIAVAAVAVVLIMQKAGAVHGNWNDWSPWGSCSATCDFGMERRERSCTHPKPGVGGDYCAGESAEYRTCKISSCRVVFSSFVVDQPRNLKNSVVTFSRTLFQQGSDYNASTGIFTCSVSGTYLFSVNLMKKRSEERVDSISCNLYKYSSRGYSENIAQLLLDPTDDDTDKGSAAVSTTVVTSLKFGDSVYLYGCTDPATTMDFRSSFTGVLLYPD